MAKPLCTSQNIAHVLQGNVFSNPNILAGLLSLLSQGLNVGSFPGAALNLPGGSPFGYSPTDDSYCLFATQPYSGAPTPAALLPGSPLPSPGGLPGAFVCVDAASNPPSSPESFTVSYGGNSFVCQGSPDGTSPAPLPTGRKLQQAPSPAEVAIGNALQTVIKLISFCNGSTCKIVWKATLLAVCADWPAHLELRSCHHSSWKYHPWSGSRGSFQ